MNYLYFDRTIGSGKPDTIRNNSTLCPFCDLKKSGSKIINQEGTFSWIYNKFPTNTNATQTLVIETDNCLDDITSYSTSYFTKLLVYIFKCREDLKKTNKYKSVILYKNHGHYSGGSIRHSHMQIVGLDDIDYLEKIEESHNTGLVIYIEDNISINIADTPMIGFTDLNIVMKNNDIENFAINIQRVVRFAKDNYLREDFSYNLFFYFYKDKVICKVCVRYPSTPMYVGFKITQVLTEKENKEIAIKFNDFIKKEK